mmetsp:Transcript_10961/g.37287  ORF Transcript_10961/g.37287 Transcript_10961/m.37287 type:complete len:249 (+) Transcript_10961:636-1382(+)
MLVDARPGVCVCEVSGVMAREGAVARCARSPAGVRAVGHCGCRSRASAAVGPHSPPGPVDPRARALRRLPGRPRRAPIVLWVSPEGDGQALQEAVHPREQRLRGVGLAGDPRPAVVDDHAVGEVGCHDEVVLHDEGRLLGVHDESLNHLCGHDALLRVEVGGGLVDEVDVRRLAQAEREGHALELPAREVHHVLVNERVHIEGLHHVRNELRVHVHVADLLVKQRAHRAVELGRDLLGLVAHVELGHL